MSAEDFYRQFSCEEEEFYALSLLGRNGKIFWETQSHWVGFTDDKPPRELRQTSRVFARVAKVWHDSGQPFIVVREVSQLWLFMLMGGHALIEPALFEQELPHFLEPSVSIPDGYAGFSGASFFDEAAFKRTPTAKLRMQILNRDGRRCRVCGRNPDNHLDLELHVHHIRPWANGGVTDQRNLITLCNTCHNGLNPHFDPNLFGYVDKNTPNISKNYAEQHASEIREYRNIMLCSELKG